MRVCKITWTPLAEIATRMFAAFTFLIIKSSYDAEPQSIATPFPSLGMPKRPCAAVVSIDNKRYAVELNPVPDDSPEYDAGAPVHVRVDSLRDVIRSDDDDDESDDSDTDHVYATGLVARACTAADEHVHVFWLWQYNELPVAVQSSIRGSATRLLFFGVQEERIRKDCIVKGLPAWPARADIYPKMYDSACNRLIVGYDVLHKYFMARRRAAATVSALPVVLQTERSAVAHAAADALQYHFNAPATLTPEQSYTADMLCHGPLCVGPSLIRMLGIVGAAS